MAKMIFDLDSKVEEEFRKTVAEVKGLHKGVIKDSLQEAILAWIREQKKLKKKGDST
jgi:hypothetical protein